MLEKVQKRVCKAFAPILAASHDCLAHHRNMISGRDRLQVFPLMLSEFKRFN